MAEEQKLTVGVAMAGAVITPPANPPPYAPPPPATELEQAQATIADLRARLANAQKAAQESDATAATATQELKVARDVHAGAGAPVGRKYPWKRMSDGASMDYQICAEAESVFAYLVAQGKEFVLTVDPKATEAPLPLQGIDKVPEICKVEPADVGYVACPTCYGLGSNKVPPEPYDTRTGTGMTEHTAESLELAPLRPCVGCGGMREVPWKNRRF